MVNKEKVILDTLKTVLEDEGLKDPNIVISDISTEGANYSSTLHYITVKSHGRDDLELFAKVACIGEQFRNNIQSDSSPYAVEPFLYRELLKMYNRLQARNNIAEEERLLFPKFYAYNDQNLEETLILENLAVKGYILHDRFESVSWDYAAAAVGELAKLHALSYALAEYYPEEFNRIVKKLTNTYQDFGEIMFPMWKKSEVNALNSAPKELKGRLRDFYFKESTMAKYNKYYSSPRRPVLVHGDYRPSNLMHKMNNGKVEKLIPVDYQTVHCGNPVVDLLYFIFCGTDGEFRKNHYDQLIEHYYTTFADYVTKLGLSPKKLYPKQHFYNDLRDNLPFGLIISTSLLPVLLVEPEKAPNVTDGSLDSFILKPNEMFVKRFREALDDFVQWGIV